MIDQFALALTHALLAIAAWRLLQRPDLDADPAQAEEAAPAETPEPRPSTQRKRPRA